MPTLPPLEPVNSEFDKATEDHLRSIENLIGAQLPRPVSDFLRRYGGAVFSGDATVTGKDGKASSVFTIFRAAGTKGSVANDLIAHPDYVDDGLLPIADDMFNNRYVVELSTGKVHFVEYGHGRRLEREIAESFDAFLAAIRVVPD